MTDFEYDCYQKKNIAHSAAKRKCGSKSKKCNLPSDSLTAKQWKERCGKVMEYQIRRRMEWAEFQSLPKDLKEEYLNNLINKYSANARTIADMFGVNPNTVLRTVKSNELNVKFLRGKHPSGEQFIEFQKFLDSDSECSDVSDVTDGEPVDVTLEMTNEPESTPGQITKLDSFTMNFSGEVNVDMIANSLRYILGSAGKAKITISCEME